MPKFRTIIRSTVAVLCIGAAGYAIKYATEPAYDGSAGISYHSAFAPERGTDIDFHLWYPSEPGGRRKTVGGNGVFHGTPAGKGAPVAAGRFPLVMISHGGGGNPSQFGWLASALTAEGFVVALPKHPGSSSGTGTAQEAVKVWTRPPDMSAVIDAIEADPETFGFIDTDRISTVGFSAGGYTSMAISGARVDPERLTRFCDDGQTGMSDCDFLARGGVDLHKVDLSPASQDHRDPRVSSAVIVDPGIVSTLTDESLAAIDIPVLILNLGEPGKIPRGVDASHAASQIPGAEYETIPDAHHFSFLARCKPKGADILAREGEPDRLCDEGPGRDRAELHAVFRDRIAVFLTSQP